MQSSRSAFINLFTGLVLLLGFPGFASAGLWPLPAHQLPGNGTIPIGLASDATGHAFAIVADASLDAAQVYSYSNGVWSSTPFNTQLYNESFQGPVAVARDATGTALILFPWYFSNGVGSALFTGTIWGNVAPAPLLSTTNNKPPVAVAMNGPRSGVAIIVDNPLVYASFFSGSVWSTPVIIGNAGDSSPVVAFSENGDVIAGWNSGSSGPLVANFYNGTWHVPLPLDPTGSFRSVGIDADGNGIALWEGSGGEINVRIFNGTTHSWLTAQNIAGNMGNFGSSLAVSSRGTAVVVWVDSSNAGQSSTYGTVWSPPFLFTNDFIVASPSVSVNDKGNALVVWGSNTPLIRSSRLSLGSNVWSNPSLVDNPAQDIQTNIVTSLSANGVGFAGWESFNDGDEQFNFFVNATLQPTPASNLLVRTCTNRSPTKNEQILEITWSPSLDPTVTAYLLYRNDELIAIIPAAGPYLYCDHSRCKSRDVYTVIAVDLDGTESTPITITLN